jgi:hypothetical protein
MESWLSYSSHILPGCKTWQLSWDVDEVEGACARAWEGCARASWYQGAVKKLTLENSAERSLLQETPYATLSARSNSLYAQDFPQFLKSRRRCRADERWVSNTVIYGTMGRGDGCWRRICDHTRESSRKGPAPPAKKSAKVGTVWIQEN